jgi:hypothetical protein
MSYMKNVLVMDPIGRLDGPGSLEHNYFEGLQPEEFEKVLLFCSYD